MQLASHMHQADNAFTNVNCSDSAKCRANISAFRVHINKRGWKCKMIWPSPWVHETTFFSLILSKTDRALLIFSFARNIDQLRVGFWLTATPTTLCSTKRRLSRAFDRTGPVQLALGHSSRTLKSFCYMTECYGMQGNWLSEAYKAGGSLSANMLRRTSPRTYVLQVLWT